MHYSVRYRPSGLPSLLALSIALALSGGTQALAQSGEVSQAEARQYHFDIQPQALDSALAAFSAVTRLQVLVQGDLTRELRSPGVSGTHAQAEAGRQRAPLWRLPCRHQ